MKKQFRFLFLICLFSIWLAGCRKESNSGLANKFSEHKSKSETYYNLQTPSPEKVSVKEAVRTRKEKEEKKTNIKSKKKTEQKLQTADTSYFDDAVFIGDSRTEGFGLQSGLKNAVFYTDKGLMVDTIFTKTPIESNGRKITIMEAVKNNSFKKIYVMFGINELGWPYNDIFIERYEKVIDELKKVQPNAVIYIQSIIHISKEKEKKSYMKNSKITERNKLIEKMAKKKNVEFLNLNEVLTDKQGFLFKDASTDGVHLNRKYCQIWKDYLIKHTK